MKFLNIWRCTCEWILAIRSLKYAGCTACHLIMNIITVSGSRDWLSWGPHFHNMAEYRGCGVRIKRESGYTSSTQGRRLQGWQYQWCLSQYIWIFAVICRGNKWCAKCTWISTVGHDRCHHSKKLVEVKLSFCWNIKSKLNKIYILRYTDYRQSLLKWIC